MKTKFPPKKKLKLNDTPVTDESNFQLKKDSGKELSNQLPSAWAHIVIDFPNPDTFDNNLQTGKTELTGDEPNLHNSHF